MSGRLSLRASPSRSRSRRIHWSLATVWLPIVIMICILSFSAFTVMASPAGQAVAGGAVDSSGLFADSIAPLVTVVFPAPDGTNGWHKTSPVVGSVTANDATTGGSTIAAINCSNATVGPITGLGTAAASASLTVSGDGGYTVSCTATDSSGNNGRAPGSTAPVIVLIDATKPVITSYSQPPASAGVWYNRNVGTFFHCDEYTSGIAVDTASCTIVVSAEGTHAVTNPGACIDRAGNAADAVTISNINIDKMSPFEVWEYRPPLVSGRNVSFRFKGVDPVSGGVASGMNHFECLLDRGSFAPCTSPWNLTKLAEGWHSVQVRAVDNAGNPDFTPGGYSWYVEGGAMPTPTQAPAPTPVSTCTTPFTKVDVGSGQAYGAEWLADQAYVPGQTSWGYVGGTTYATQAQVTGTADPVLYQTERWWAQGGQAGYRFEAPNGRYHIVLRFAEIYPWTWAKTRVFSVWAEGQLVANNLDVFAGAGGLNRAFDLSGTAADVSVSDGVLQIDFQAVTSNPMLNAIEVYKCQP